MLTCCVTGHRQFPALSRETLWGWLESAVQQAIDDGYACFLSGFAEGADQMFAQIVYEKSRRYPIRLEAALPYRDRYRQLTHSPAACAPLRACAAVHMVSEDYAPGVYHKRNRFMVEHSSRVIAAYDGRKTGGTAYTVNYARRLGRQLILLPIAGQFM